MSASIHPINAETGYAIARRVLCTTGACTEAEAAAVAVLMSSPDAKDRALVRFHHDRVARAELTARIDADARAAGAVRKLRFLMFSAAVAGGILGGVLMEAAMTAAVSASL